MIELKHIIFRKHQLFRVEWVALLENFVYEEFCYRFLTEVFCFNVLFLLLTCGQFLKDKINLTKLIPRNQQVWRGVNRSKIPGKSNQVKTAPQLFRRKNLLNSYHNINKYLLCVVFNKFMEFMAQKAGKRNIFPIK